MPGFLALKKLDSRTISNTSVWRGDRISSDNLVFKCLGDYSPEFYGSLYEQAVQELKDYTVSKNLKGNLIINTGGFVKGMAVFMIENLLKILKPHAIIEISTRGDTIVRNLSNPR